MSYPKSPGDPQAHRELAARHLAVVQERNSLRAALARVTGELAAKEEERLKLWNDSAQRHNDLAFALKRVTGELAEARTRRIDIHHSCGCEYGDCSVLVADFELSESGTILKCENGHEIVLDYFTPEERTKLYAAQAALDQERTAAARTREALERMADKATGKGGHGCICRCPVTDGHTDDCIVVAALAAPRRSTQHQGD